MPVVKDLSQLGKLVAVNHGWTAAKAFKAYEMDDADRSRLTTCAMEILQAFPKIARAGAVMSAAFAIRLERATDAPIQVVSGVLRVENEPVFGENEHVWLMVGPYIADISLFRTAYSASGPALLSRHVDLVFGPNKALYVANWKHARGSGLGYEPRYVLGEDEVTALMGEAFALIRNHRDASAAHETGPDA